MGQYFDEGVGFVSGLGVDPATAKMVGDCISDPKCTDNAIKVGNWAWSKAVASRDAIVRTAERTIGAITGSSRDAKRSQNKGKAQAKGIWYRQALGPLYDQCFGTSDWFQNTRNPPQPNVKRANPKACCDLIKHYREAAVKGWTARVGKKYGPYSLRVEGGVNVGNRINPQHFMDTNYGGSFGYPRSDSDEWHVSNLCFGPKVGPRWCLPFKRGGVGCGARDQRPYCRNRDEETMAMTTGFCRIRPQPTPKPKPSARTFKRAVTAVKPATTTAERRANAQRAQAQASAESTKTFLIVGGIAAVALGGTYIMLKRRKK